MPSPHQTLLPPRRPNFHNFMATVQLLKDWGADLSSTKVSAKHLDCPLLRSLQAAPAEGA